MSADGDRAPDGERRSGLSWRVAGVPVEMPWSGVLGVLLIAYLWSPNFATRQTGRGQEIAVALVFAVLFYAAVLLHEVGHAVVARACGYPVQRIVLWVLGGYTSYHRHDESSWREGLIAAAGPATSLLLGAVCWGIGATGLAGDGSAAAVVAALAWSNTLLGIYNALPGLPLDGGAVLKSLVWGATGSEHRGTVVAGWAGRVVAVAVFVLPLVPFLLRGQQPPLTVVVFGGLVASYLFVGANDALRRSTVGSRVPALAVSALTRPVVAVGRDEPLAEAVRRVHEAGAGGFVVTDGDGQVVAIGHEEAVRAVPLERRPWVPAGSVARTLDPAARLPVALTGHAFVAALQSHPAAEYLVVGPDGRVVGVLLTTDVERALTAAR